jgi:nicotinate-nucleotide pyrophosphorylase (carboxylating)
MPTESGSELGLEPSQGLSDEITDCIRRALAEDIGTGDVTTDSIVPANAQVEALIKAKQNGVVAGLDVAAAVFHSLDETVRLTANVSEASTVESGTVVATISGAARTVLTGERTALNFLGRMSGIATLTRQFVDLID